MWLKTQGNSGGGDSKYQIVVHPQSWGDETRYGGVMLAKSPNQEFVCIISYRNTKSKTIGALTISTTTPTATTGGTFTISMSGTHTLKIIRVVGDTFEESSTSFTDSITFNYDNDLRYFEID